MGDLQPFRGANNANCSPISVGVWRIISRHLPLNTRASTACLQYAGDVEEGV